MNDKRKAYEEKAEAQMEEWNAELALLKAKADNAKADIKIEYYRKIEILQQKHKDIRKKLEELKNSGDDAWEDLKEGAEKAWSEVKTAFNKAASNFK
jgi:hypothetical protein